MEVERESSAVGLESIVKLEPEKVTELTDTAWDGDVLKLAPVKNESLSFHACFCFSFIFCLLGWYVFSGFSSSLLASVKNCNLRGRVVPCTLFQIPILNSQPTFASIPTFNSTLQSIFNHTQLWGKTIKTPSFKCSICLFVYVFAQQSCRKQFMGKFVSCCSTYFLLMLALSLEAELQESF